MLDCPPSKPHGPFHGRCTHACLYFDVLLCCFGVLQCCVAAQTRHCVAAVGREAVIRGLVEVMRQRSYSFLPQNQPSLNTVQWCRGDTWPDLRLGSDFNMVAKMQPFGNWRLARGDNTTAVVQGSV